MMMIYNEKGVENWNKFYCRLTALLGIIGLIISLLYPPLSLIMFEIFNANCLITILFRIIHRREEDITGFV